MGQGDDQAAGPGPIATLPLVPVSRTWRPVSTAVQYGDYPLPLSWPQYRIQTLAPLFRGINWNASRSLAKCGH